MWRIVTSLKQFSEESPMDFEILTPRNRSRTTKLVHPGLGVSSDSHFSAGTPIGFATSQARSSPNTINLIVSEPPFLDQKPSTS